LAREQWLELVQEQEQEQELSYERAGSNEASEHNTRNPAGAEGLRRRAARQSKCANIYLCGLPRSTLKLCNRPDFGRGLPLVYVDSWSPGTGLGQTNDL